MNDSEGWLCIEKVSGEVHTAQSLQGAQPGDTYTVLVEAQDTGMARKWWDPLGGGTNLRQTDSRTELPPRGPRWQPPAPSRRGRYEAGFNVPF